MKKHQPKLQSNLQNTRILFFLFVKIVKNKVIERSSHTREKGTTGPNATQRLEWGLRTEKEISGKRSQI